MRVKSAALTLLVASLVAIPGAAQTTAHVLRVDEASAVLLESHPPQLSVAARGIVPDTGWKNPKLIPAVYFVPPEDGIWDFTFVADRYPGFYPTLITPVTAIQTIPDPPDWVKGVRVKASFNSKEALLGKKLALNFDDLPGEMSRGASITLEADYEQSGNKHCVVVDAKVKINGFEKDIEVGRFCIRAGRDCIDGEKSISGIDVHWKLCLKNGGRKLCFSAKACKDFGWPIGERCTDWADVCVAVE